jgi:hypothetical protein
VQPHVIELDHLGPLPLRLPTLHFISSLSYIVLM